MVKSCRVGVLISFSIDCYIKGEVNAKVKRKDSSYWNEIYLCNSHKEIYIQEISNMGWVEVELIDIKLQHICGLILCKECLDNVEEILSY